MLKIKTEHYYNVAFCVNGSQLKHDFSYTCITKRSDDRDRKADCAVIKIALFFTERVQYSQCLEFEFLAKHNRF